MLDRPGIRRMSAQSIMPIDRTGCRQPADRPFPAPMVIASVKNGK